VPRSYVAVGFVVAVVMIAVGFLPLFGGPGYEHTLATGLVAPTAAAIATALDRRAPSALALLGRGALAGIAFALLSLATAFVHALRGGVCEITGALVYFALTAGAGAVLGGVWGAFVGELVRSWVKRRPRTVAVLAAIAGPVAGVVVSIYRFVTSPMIFAFDPFVGYFSGTLYDTVIDAGAPLLTYRLGTLATITAAALGASVFERPRKLDLRTTATRVRALLAAASLLASATLTLVGTKLGHFSTAESIAKDLGAEKHGERCDVVYPSTTREQEARLLVTDCDEEIRAVEARLGARGPERIRAFFFRDDADKKRLMGAAHTYIAKPWRREVYLQLAAYPHPVLGHELAHVVAGSFGRGPFRVAGPLGGLWPNPGLIEGVAVAASPDDEDLTDAQWARAMMDIGLLPSMRRVFSLGFLGDASAKSYTLAGAFVDWMGATYGMDAVRAWYGGADIVALTGKDWPALEAGFKQHLAGIALVPEAASFARAKFGRPGIFGRKCPHVVDAIRHEADTCRDSQRFDDAIRLYRSALDKDPQDFASKHSLAVTERRHRDREEGRAALEAMAQRDEVPRTWRDRADEALADADFIDGNLDGARIRYEGLAARSLDEDAARTLEVKAIATKTDAARGAVGALLLGDEKHGPDIFLAGVALGRWSDDALADYLVGRNLVQRGFYENGAAVLDAALVMGLPTPRIARETLRQRAIAACATRDRPALDRVRARIEGPDDPFRGASGGRRDATLRLIARCAR
jgi:hypothetical protein